MMVRRLLAVALAVAGCGTKSAADGASCKRVADHVGALARGDLAQLRSSDEREPLSLLMGPLHDEVEKTCEARGWSKEVRTCMSAAASGAAVATCAHSLRPDQRRSAGTGTPTAP
jgi:hypothetical protein